jgi:hypothetical protein
MARRKTGNGFFVRKLGGSLNWAVWEGLGAILKGGEKIILGKEESGRAILGGSRSFLLGFSAFPLEELR